jgi:hypothetical protein
MTLATYVHGNGDDHELGVEGYERLVLGKADLVDKSDLDDAQEVPVQGSIDDENEDLGDLVPNFVDLDEGLAHGWYGVRRNPDTEDGDVDGGDDDECAPFDVADGTPVFGDESDPVDDDLHEQLDLEDPEGQDEEEDRDTVLTSAIARAEYESSFLRGTQHSSQEQPSDHSNAHVDEDLTPQHVDVDRPQRVAVPPRLLDGLPYCKKPEPDCEARCRRSKLEVFDCCRHGEWALLLND